MVRTKSEIVLRMALPQFGYEFDDLEVFSSVIELEGQRSLAYLASHLAVGVPVVLTQISVSLLLDLLSAN
jgi:hypothetical protein